MTNTERAIVKVKNQLLNYDYGYDVGKEKEKSDWENVLKELKTLAHLRKGLNGLLK